QQAAQDLYILASPQSPMRDLLASIARQLTLTQPPPLPGGGVAEAGKDVAKDAAKTAVRQLAPQASVRLQPLASAALAAIPVEPPGKQIDDRYRALRDYVGTGPGAPIDQTLKAMDGLRQQLNRIAAGAAPGASPSATTGEDAAVALRAEA